MAYSRTINSGEGTSRPTVARAKQSVKTEKHMIKKVLAFNVTNIHCKSRDVYGMKVCDRKERLLDYACHLSERLEI